MKLPFSVSKQEIIIEKLVPGGQGIGTDSDGKKGFFWNVLPGELVTDYTITKNKSHFFEAIAISTENSSKNRISPQDDCYLSTSPWQIMDYDYELAQKKELLAEVFHQNHVDISGFLDKTNVQTDGKMYHYRNKMEYSLYWDIEKSKIKLAFHKRGTHHKEPITSSSIERPEIYNMATQIVEGLNARHEEARKYQSLLLRANQSGEVSGGLYENHQPHPVFKNLNDTILGNEYSYSPNGFFQINLPVYEMALVDIKQHITTNKVLDLYAGVGTIGLSVANDRELVLVENNKSAYAELEKNCQNVKLNDPRGLSPTPILSNSEEALDCIQPDQTVIVDPPRAGCDKKLIEKLLDAKPQKIIYLSCNPATQARDVAILTGVNSPVDPISTQTFQQLYKIKSVIPYNFFPRTPHLENLVVLSLK